MEVLSLLSKGVEKMGVLFMLVVALNVALNVVGGDEGSCDGDSCDGDSCDGGSVVAGA